MFQFSTKAGTLESLRGRLTSAALLPQVHFPVSDWAADRARILEQITATFGERTLVVRSSCKREDSEQASFAGAFLSLLDVQARDVADAIDQVVEAYGTPEAGDQVLVQSMLSGVVRAGVAFSHEPGTGAPYRVINWSEDGDTTAATSGKDVRMWQQAARSDCTPPDGLKGVLALTEELLEVTGGNPIDLEFAVAPDDNGTETLWLLQCRPLIMQAELQSVDRQHQLLEDVERFVDRSMRPHPFVKGAQTVFGVMPDWNPAEIIGLRPRPLALSLYRDLITDSIWALSLIHI